VKLLELSEAQHSPIEILNWSFTKICPLLRLLSSEFPVSPWKLTFEEVHLIHRGRASHIITQY